MRIQLVGESFAHSFSTISPRADVNEWNKSDKQVYMLKEMVVLERNLGVLIQFLLIKIRLLSDKAYLDNMITPEIG